MDRLPRDILFQIISFDISLASTVYKLNKTLSEISYADPNFCTLVKSKFHPLINWNIQNALSPCDASFATNAITVANTLPQVKTIVDIAIGHPKYSLNTYLSLLMTFGISMNTQVSNLQNKISNATNKIQSLKITNDVQLTQDEYHEFISIWYELQYRTFVMHQRINYWLQFQNEMIQIMDGIRYCCIEWLKKLEWILSKDTEYQLQFDTYFHDGHNSFSDIITFFTANDNDQRDLFESSFIRWTAEHIQRQDLISQLQTIIDVIRLSQDFHNAFLRLYKVIKSMKQMTVSVLQNDQLK